LTDTHSDSRRIPSLDGLRAISIAAVVSSHLLWHGETGPHALIRTALGRMGVQVFFVVSGFLITRLLVREQGARGRISLARFFQRRAIRILPPYLVYVVTVVAISRLVAVPMPRADVAHALTFTMNFASDRSSWVLAHGWSLSTEEQFYLAWPLLAVAFGWTRTRWLAAVVAAVPFVQFAVTGALPSIHWFPNGVDGIAAGCLLALLWDDPQASRVLRRMTTGATPLVALALVIARIALAPYHVGTLLETLSGGAIAMLVARVVLHPGGFASALNAAPAVWLGKLSYSLYLWQQLFTRPTLEREPLPFPLAVACALGCAVISYYAVERPLLAARARLRAPISDAARPAAPARLQTSWRDSLRRAISRRV